MLSGDIILSPSCPVSPGDVRKLQVINLPELAHFENCIVFSQQSDEFSAAGGKNPIPSLFPRNCFSGARLDGSTFWVCWEENIVRGVTKTYPPHKIKQVSAKGSIFLTLVLVQDQKDG